MADGNELVSTADVAQQLGLKESTIRAWLSRYPEVFREGDHHVTLDNKRFWTPAGVELLQSRVTQNAALPEALQATGDVAEEIIDCNSTPDRAGSLDIDQRLQPLADQIAAQIIEQRLPVLVHQAIDRLLTNPSDLDNQRMAELLDRVGTGLGLVKLSGAIASGLRAALTASQEQLKLPGVKSDV